MFPAPHTVTHSVAEATGTDALGQATIEYTDQTRNVYGWSVKANDDGNSPVMAGRVTTELHLLTPDGDWADGDKVTLPDGREFTVAGEPFDSNTGPFGFTPGYRVALRRVHDGS